MANQKTINKTKKERVSKKIEKNEKRISQVSSFSNGHVLTQARIINFTFNKKGKLKKLRCNYGANFDEKSRYFVHVEAANAYADELNRAQEERIRLTGEASKKKTKKKKIVNFIYFALNIIVIGIILGVQLSKESNPLESLSVIFDINWWFLLAAIGTFVVCTIADQIKYSALIHKATGLFRFRLSYKITALGRHYDVITPLATGGQPFQVFYANKYGIKPGESISIMLGRYIFYQIVYFICISFVLFNNLFTHSLVDLVGDVGAGIVTTLSWIGYAISFIVIFLICFVTLNRRVGTGFIAGILKLLNKIKFGKHKLIKNYNKTFGKSMRIVNDWQKTTKKYGKSFWVILVNVLGSALFFASWYAMPYFIYCAFNGWDSSVWSTIITMAVMVDLSSAFNPIPMGIGTADLSFTVLYAAFFIPSAQVWALIIWRFLAYYIYILQGLVVLTYDYAIGDRRLSKNKEFWMLPYRERLRIRREERLNKKLNDLSR